MDGGRVQPTLLAVLALIPLAVYDMLVGLPAATQSLERIRRSSSRVFEVIDAPPAVSSPQVAHRLAPGSTPFASGICAAVTAPTGAGSLTALTST